MNCGKLLGLKIQIKHGLNVEFTDGYNIVRILNNDMLRQHRLLILQDPEDTRFHEIFLQRFTGSSNILLRNNNECISVDKILDNLGGIVIQKTNEFLKINITKFDDECHRMQRILKNITARNNIKHHQRVAELLNFESIDLNNLHFMQGKLKIKLN